MGAKMLKEWGGAIVIGVVVMWSFAAPWLSANQVISVFTDLSSYIFGILLLLSAILLYILYGKAPRVRAVRLAFCTCAFFGFLWAWRHSSEAFTYWKMKTIPTAEWSRMATDLQTLAQETSTLATEGFWEIRTSERLPDSIRPLGRATECHGVVCRTIEGYSGIIVYVAYGGPGRKWGLLVGSEEVVKANYQKFSTLLLNAKRTRVAQDAYFFVNKQTN